MYLKPNDCLGPPLWVLHQCQGEAPYQVEGKQSIVARIKFVEHQIDFIEGEGEREEASSGHR